MKTKLMTTGLFALVALAATAQTAPVAAPKGKAIVQVFGSFNTGLGTTNDQRGFDLERSYLGYEHQLDQGLTVRAVMDIGKSSNVSDYQRLAYIKNAMIAWKTGRLTLEGGLISTTRFRLQERFWGYRYVRKSFQDQYGMGSSADLGISAAYKCSDWLAVDGIIVNGEGYKKVQKNDGLNYGLGFTLTPIKGFQMRVYGDLNEGGEAGQKNINNWAAFAGYKNRLFDLGVEYNRTSNAGFRNDADLNGFSAYGSLRLSPTAQLFARIDDLDSKNDWNLNKDETVALVGAQIQVGKYVKLAPNFRMNIPKADGAANQYSAAIHCFFGL